MKRAWLTAALAAVQPLVVLPLSAAAQEPAKPDAPCRVEQVEKERASAALPARVGTHPMPERGTIAPAARVPSNVVTPSSRAMAAARAREQGESAKKTTQDGCQPAAQQAAPVEGAKKD